MMVYYTAVSKHKVDYVYGFCIAGTLGISCLAIGDVTGAGLNPWRILPASILTGELFTSAYSYAWVYYLGNTLAGVVCGLLWRLVYVGCGEQKPSNGGFCSDEEAVKLNVEADNHKDLMHL